MSDTMLETLEMQRAAALEGFDWRELSELWIKLAEEIDELKEATTQGPERIRDELGDVLFMVINLARHLGVDPADALAQANQKFKRRYAYVIKEPTTLPELGHPGRLDAMEARWQEAKKLESRNAVSSFPLPLGGGPDTVSRSAGVGGAAPALAPALTVPGTVSRAQG